MRPLTEDELKQVLTKISKYIGKNTRHLIDRADENYCFRLHNDRVFYVKESLLKMASMVDSDQIASLGTSFGKFTKTRKFRLHITCLDIISQYALYKMWIKPSGVMSFLYGKNVHKAHLGRITEGTPKYHGVVIMSMNDLPLGFGVAAFSTDDCRKVDSAAVVAFNQSDIGEYLRKEDSGNLM